MCSVVGCDSGRRGAHRFKLPEDPERRLQWVQFLLEVNEQRLKESSWTDITICRHHFTADCFVNPTRTGSVQLRSGAVPSVCVKSEPDEPEPCQEPEETTEVTFQYDELKSCDSPSSYSEESGRISTASQESPAPSDASDAFMSDYGQMLQKVENIDMIRKKAALLQIKGKYVVNEKRLLQLFSHKCPSCGSKVKTEKVTCGVLVVVNQQCPQCEYRNQWKSQVNASVPTAEDQHLTEEVELEVEATPETQQRVSTDDNCSSVTGMSEMVAVTDEEMDETEESNNEGDTDSDSDWNPAGELLLANELHDESEEETDDEEEEEGLRLDPKHGQLCTECGKFFNNQWPHTCEHKTKPYSCNICGKRCVSENALNSHSRIHDENYEYRCKYCGVTFKTKVDKMTHQQIHLTQGKPYKCPDCSETFTTNKQRRIHLKDHRGPEPLKCPICGVDFTYNTSIQRHMAVHTGVKPYKCSECQRGFSQAGHLKSHMRMHTGERPFKCQHCDKSFNHNVSLKSHVERYHSSSSGRERKKGKINKTVSDAGDAQENGNKRGTDSELDNVEEEHDKEEDVQRERKHMPKCKKRSTGRPVGRPKRNSEGDLGETRRRRSNTKTAKVQVQKLKRTRCSDEESEDEPSESDMSFDPTEEEEENSEKVTSSTSRSRGRAKNSDSDSDFDPEERKKKRYSSQNRGKSSGKRRGRPRKNQVDEDTEHCEKKKLS